MNREKPRDRLDVLRDGRLYLLGLLERKLHPPVTRRVRRDAGTMLVMGVLGATVGASTLFWITPRSSGHAVSAPGSIG